jgi:hypothetical protein
MTSDVSNSSRDNHLNASNETDPLDTSVGLLLGFLGSMVAATLALATGTTASKWPWFVVIATIVAATSRRTGILWAGYNGLIAGFFFNFMRPPARRLAFDSVSSVAFEGGFIAAALAGHYVWRRWHARSEARAAPETLGPKTAPPRKRTMESLYLTPRQRERAARLQSQHDSDTD